MTAFACHSKSYFLCDGKNIITLIAIITCLIAMILMSFHAYRYFKFRKHMVLKKRFAEVTLFVYLCQMLKQFTWMLLLINNLLWYHNNRQSQYYDYYLLWKIIRIPITYYLYFCCIFGWIARFWISNYTMHLSKESLQNKWQSIINSSMTKNWYIEHKNTLGNIKFISIIMMLILIIIVGSLSYLKYTKNGDNNEKSEIVIGIEIFTCLVSTLILYAIYQRIPVLDDNFFIYEELKRLLYVLVIIIIPFWLIGIVLQLHWSQPPSMNINNMPTDLYIYTTIYEILTGLAQVSGVLISTWWINGKILPIIMSSKYRLRQKGSVEYITQVSTRYSVNLTNNSSNITNTSSNGYKRGNAPNEFSELILNTAKYHNQHDIDDQSDFTVPHEVQQESILYVDMLQSERCFEEFVLYLSKDYCIENMLGFIEIVQFQQYVNEYINAHTDEIEMHHKLKIPLYKSCKFPEKIPKSMIVFGEEKKEESNDNDDNDNNSNDDDDDDSNESELTMEMVLRSCKLSAYKLYKKYITSNGADYKIDISDSVRYVLDQWIQNKKSWMNNNMVDFEDLLEMFDDCVDECFSILCDSYQRFIQTDKYQKIKDSTFD